MAEEAHQRDGRGRESTIVAILDAAEELFSAQGFTAVTVRAIAERAGVSHALVHRYLGSKADVYRAVLTRNEELILQASADNPDLVESATLMLREALSTQRTYIRLITHSALHGLPYDRSSGRFAATERLIELALEAASSASPAERREKDMDPRLVVAGVVALLLGWVATESWVLPAAGLGDMDQAEAEAGLETLIRGMLGANVAGLGGSEPTAD